MSSNHGGNTNNEQAQSKARAHDFAEQMRSSIINHKGKNKPFTEAVLQQAKKIELSDSPLEESKHSLEEIHNLLVAVDASHRKSSRSRRAGEVLRPFIEGLERYTGVIDTIIQSNPTLSALIWGGVKFVLVIAQQHYEKFDNLSGHLEKIPGYLDQLGVLSKCFDFWKLSQSFDFPHEILNLVTESYQIVFQILDALAGVYEQSGFKLLFKRNKAGNALWKQLEDKIEVLQTWAQGVHMLVGAKQAEDAQQKKIDDWLVAPLGDTIYEQCTKARCDGTCLWLDTHPVYQQWEHFTPTTDPNSSERLLWVNGPPGIGKTFLATSVIERLQKNGYQVVYYFFREEKSDDPRARKGKAMTFLRYIAKQLVRIIQQGRSRSLPAKFWELHRLCGGGCLSNLDRAVEVVQVLLNVLPRIHIVVDGLDECEDRADMKNTFASPGSAEFVPILPWVIKTLAPADSRSRYNGLVKWLFTSCVEADLVVLFTQTLHARVLKVTHEMTACDVATFLEVRTNPGMHCKARRDISSGEIRLALDRGKMMMNFLDARLSLDILYGYGSTYYDDVVEALSGYQPGFNETYIRALKLVAKKPQSEQDLARMIFAFVSVAENPLTVSELLDGIAALSPKFRFGITYPPNSRTPRSRSKLEELLSPLLELDYTADPDNPIVRTIHRTARDFLLQEPANITNLPDSCRPLFMSMADRELLVGTACLNYLCYHRDPPNEVSSVDPDCELVRIAPAGTKKALEDSHPDYLFLKYASIFWFRHLGNATKTGTSELFNAVQRFMCSRHFINCLWVQSIYAPYLLARYTCTHVDPDAGGLQYRINKPNEILSLCFKSISAVLSPKEYCYGDFLPSWLASFTASRGAELVRECQKLVMEFGMIFLSRNGGVMNFHPGPLGRDHFTKGSWPRDLRWKAIPLDPKQKNNLVGAETSVSCEGETNRVVQQQLITIITSHDQLIARCLVVNAEPTGLSTATFQDWCIPLHRNRPGRRPKVQSMGKVACLDLATGHSRSQFDSPASWNHRLICAVGHQGTIFTAGSDVDLLYATFSETGCVEVSELGCGPPSNALRPLSPLNSNLDLEGWVFKNRQCATSANHTTIAVSHRWIKMDTATTRRHNVGPSAEESLTTQPGGTQSSGEAEMHVHWHLDEETLLGKDFSLHRNDWDDPSSSTDSDSESEQDDSRYSSGSSSTLDFKSPLGNVSGLASVAIVSLRPSSEITTPREAQWYHYRTSKMPLRISPPAVEPSGSVVIFPIDGNRTVLIDNVKGSTKELYSEDKNPLLTPVAIFYHFMPPSEQTAAGPMLYRLTVVAQDLSRHWQWNLELTLLSLPEPQESWDNLDLGSFTNFGEIASGRVSWVCPYNNPFDHHNYPSLPFLHSWTDGYLNIAFGACELYICRIQLTPVALPDDIPESSPLPGLQCENQETTASSGCRGINTEGNSNTPNTRQTPPRLVLPVFTPKSNLPTFLPASTVIRQFDFHTVTISQKEYVLFALAASAELDLPPVLIFRDVEEDLGGWVMHVEEESEGVPAEVRIGHGANGDEKEGEQDWDMRGKCSGNEVTYNVAVRSGLAWNVRLELVCR